MDEKQSVPLWISDFLFCDVFQMLLDDVILCFRSRSLHSGKLPCYGPGSFRGTGRIMAWNVSPGIAQFAFGFYSVMLTSTVLGFVTMLLF